MDARSMESMYSEGYMLLSSPSSICKWWDVFLVREYLVKWVVGRIFVGKKLQLVKTAGMQVVVVQLKENYAGDMSKIYISKQKTKNAIAYRVYS